MIQFNLLPDVKLEYIRAQRTKRLVIISAGLVIAACVVILLILVGSVYGLQRAHLSNLDDDIADKTQTIQEIDHLNRILTVQNQLGDINRLHADKPVSSRLFTYIEEVTPSNVSINTLEVDFDEGTMEISGETESLANVNKFVDTLKFVTYTETDGSDNEASQDDQDDAETETKNAFSEVVLSSFGKKIDETSYTVTLSYNPIIFDSVADVTLDVQNRITTRSEVDRPDALFRTPEEPEDAED